MAPPTNPDAPEQVCDPTESDTTRAYSNRLQIDVFLKLPVPEEKRNFNAGKVNADEANIPKPARKAYEQGLKLQKENQPQQALTQFNQAAQDSLAGEFDMLAPDEAADVAIMLWATINSTVARVVYRGGQIARVHQVVDRFLDLLFPRSASAEG